MRFVLTKNSVKLWLSAKETHDWANKSGALWPCSTISGKSLFAEFDTNGLLDFSTRPFCDDIDGNEFNAMTSDFLKGKLPEGHPVCIGRVFC